MFDEGLTEWTLVGIASYFGRIDFVNLALNHGADPRMKSIYAGKKLDSLEWAKFAGNETVADIIEKHIAQLGVSNDPLRPKRFAYSEEASNSLKNELRLASGGIDYNKLKRTNLKSFLDNGADPNITFHETNWTVLNFIASKSYSIREGFLNTIGWAKKAGNDQLVQVLEKHEEMLKRNGQSQ